jgi:N-acetylmuramoyl-L-alanine amidase
VTFAVANRLKTLIETRLGMRVLLTRTGDRAVTLDERAAIANNNKADVFISLHANASARRALKGAEVFYLSLDNYGDQARRIAAAERQTLPVFGGGERDIEIVQWDMAQARHVDESMRLAGMIEAELRGKVEMGPRAMQQAPFRVLSGANMPAVLVEMGFVSNAEQERQLTSDAFQTAVAQALFDAVVRFRDSLAARTPVAGLTPAPLDPPTEKGGAR